MKFFITGGAGFIGSNLAEELLQKGDVTVYDNLSLGKKEFLDNLKHEKHHLKLIEEDLLDMEKLTKEIKGHDVVWHLAACSDISQGGKQTDMDLKNGTIATYNVLEAMRLNNIKKIVFSSTSAIYGETDKLPIPEDHGPLFPISFYGASKLAGEALISSFCHNFDFQAWIYRFANVVGRHGTHGALFDFINKLKSNPEELEILGDGKQSKPYIEVKDCVAGMIFGYENAKEQLNYFNLGCNGNTCVTKIAEAVVKEMGLEDVKFNFTGGSRGWKGDVPLVAYDVTKVNKLGWHAKYTSDEAVAAAAKDLVKELN
jgi:UDP-glucose 4-epimerase